MKVNTCTIFYKNNNSFKKNNISFGSAELDIKQKLSYLNTPRHAINTGILRGVVNGKATGDVMPWDLWRDYLPLCFAGKDNIVIHNMACSDGSEPYSHSIAWLESKQRKPNQNLKVVASDINPTLIELGNERKINLDDIDRANLRQFVKSGKDYFIKSDNKPIPLDSIIPNADTESAVYRNAHTYTPSPELQQMVSFQKMDMLTHLEQIKDDGNSIVSSSNVFMYQKPWYVREFIELLFEKLKSPSILKIGYFDIAWTSSPLWVGGNLYRTLFSKMDLLDSYGILFRMK